MPNFDTTTWLHIAIIILQVLIFLGQVAHFILAYIQNSQQGGQ